MKLSFIKLRFSLLIILCISLLAGGCAKSGALGQTLAQDSVACAQESTIPAFDGEPYIELNGNIPLFTDEEKERTDAFELYSELDRLGRCGTAYANICAELMPDEPRGEIGQIKPSGWQIVKYDFIDGNYLYNRCHLIGYQLAGENANEKNLITGTRYLNVTGMLPFENEVANYVRNTGNHVLYRVTPIFEGDNLVASGVTMEAYSVEDSGGGVCFYVYAYNCQPGVEIDYATGKSRLSEASPISDNSEVLQEAESDTEPTYILNTNTMKFHLPDCESVSEMSEHNKQETTASREEIIAAGYSPCKRCKP